MMTHTPHLEALRSAVAAAEQISSAEDLQALVDHIWELADQFKSFKRIKEAYPLSPNADFLIDALRTELRQREELEARDVFTTKQAADYLDLHERSVKDHYTYTKYLVGELVNPRLRLFRKPELNAFMNNPKAHQRGPKENPPAKQRPPVNKAAADDPGNDPARYDELSQEQQTALLRWIKEDLHLPWLKSNSSYGLKHKFEKSPGGFYINNGQFKGAMLAAGYIPEDTDAINWKFQSPRQ